MLKLMWKLTHITHLQTPPQLMRPSPNPFYPNAYSLSSPLIRCNRHCTENGIKGLEKHPTQPFVLLLRSESESELAKLGLWGQTIEAADTKKAFSEEREPLPRAAMLASLFRIMAACCRSWLPTIHVGWAGYLCTLPRWTETVWRRFLIQLEQNYTDWV